MTFLLHDEAAQRGLAIAIIGVPKTIDNDVSFVQRTYGFDTAVTEAQARDVWQRTPRRRPRATELGLVKLMGRDSGFIAAYSALVNNHVNFCLVPEVPFTLYLFLSECGSGSNVEAMRWSWSLKAPART